MPLNTVALGVAITPAVVSTFFSHYLHRKSLHSKPNVHISYDEGIRIFREFLAYASKHTVEDLQSFTTQWVPSPHWVRTETVTIPADCLAPAATALIDQLGPKGLARVGGKEWWQWRGPAEELKGEWIEMRNDYNERKQAKGIHPSRKRVMLYIHGGAYYFGSVDTHRYQMQRHARKLKGRVFARTKHFLDTAKYRLAPQFPFPCALYDSLAAYLYLLNEYKPNEIIFAGDSAGGGLALSMLVIIRDQGLPLPAGAILISPWVDLTHSFPSIMTDNPGDYIPPGGFRHKHSQAWPPPNEDELHIIRKALGKKPASESGALQAIPAEDSQAQEIAEKGYSVHGSSTSLVDDANANGQPVDEDQPANISVSIDGKTVEIKDQIHMYTPNQMLSHPLVSPALQPSLGGLPPLQVLTGGGEMLRDEQIYIAHKAANPTAYPPSDAYLDEHDPNREILNKYPGTNIQLQVWDDLCHVAPTLSFTRPAKYMYRSVAQFGAWALACAQNARIDILKDNDVSPISSSDSDSPNMALKGPSSTGDTNTPVSSIGMAGDPLPPFKDHMISQRVDKRGHVYPLDSSACEPALQMPNSKIGTINPALVKNWLAGKKEWDQKYAKEKLKVQRQRITELAHGYGVFNGEFPPACSLAARKDAPGVLPSRNGRKSYPMTMWSHWASKHDEKTIAREVLKDKDGSPRKTSVNAGKAGQSIQEPQNDKNITFAAGTADPNKGQPDSGSQAPAAIDVEKANGHVTNGNETGENTSGSDDKPLSPVLVLPSYEGRFLKEEAASAASLFHSPGIIASNSDGHMPRLGQRPVSQAGSGTIRSGFLSDIADDNSTLGDRSLAVTNTGTDGASTRALFNSTGVIGAMNDGESGYRSVEALSAPRGSADFETASSVGTGVGDLSRANSRPGMPGRDVFKTADEYITS